MATTPIWSPDGNVHQIPNDQVDSALKAGGQKAVQLKDPTDVLRWMPESQVQSALQAGARPLDQIPTATIQPQPAVGSLPWIKSKLYEGADVATRQLPALGGIAGGTAGFAYGGPVGAVGGAGAGGMAGKSVENIARKGLGFTSDVPKSPDEYYSSINREGLTQAGMQVGGEVIGQTARLLPKAGATNFAINPEIESMLHSKGITPSAGELAGPGSFVAKAERSAGQTAVGSGPAQKFLTNRQSKIQGWANDLANEVSQTSPNAEDLGMSLKGAGTQAAEGERQAGRTLRNKVAQDISGVQRGTASDQGQTILDAVRNKFTADKQVIGNAYTQLQDDVAKQGLRGQWNDTIKTPDGTIEGPKAFAARLYQNGLASAKQGASLYSPKVMDILGKVAGITADEAANPAMEVIDQTAKGLGYRNANDAITKVGKDTFAKYLPADIRGALDSTLAEAQTAPLSDLMSAKSAIGETKRVLQDTKTLGSSDAGALKKLDQLMTQDLENQLGPLANDWKQARNMTLAQKQEFNSTFLKSLFKQDNPVAPEKVIRTLMANGTETDAANLMKIIKDDPQAIANARRASTDWVLNNGKTGAKSLELLENKPGMKAILGPEYDTLHQTLEGMRQAEIDPTIKAYPAYLKKLTGNVDPANIVKGAMSSPFEADQLSRAIGSNQVMRAETGRDMFQRLLNDSSGGTFGAEGARFDPLNFTQKYQQARPSLQKFIDPKVLANLDKFSEGMSKLHLSTALSGNSVAASFETLGLIKAAPAAAKTMIGGAVASVFYGHPFTAVGLVGGSFLGHMSPRWFTNFALSEEGSRLLAQGVEFNKMPVGQSIPRLGSAPSAARGSATAPVTQWLTNMGRAAANLASNPAKTPSEDQARKYTSVDQVMQAAKEGEITPAEAQRITQQLGGNRATVTRPIPPPK